MSSACVGSLRQRLLAVGLQFRALCAVARPAELYATQIKLRRDQARLCDRQGAVAMPPRPPPAASAPPFHRPHHALPAQVLEVEFNTGQRFTYPAEYLRVESPAAGNQDSKDARGQLKVWLWQGAAGVTLLSSWF